MRTRIKPVILVSLFVTLSVLVGAADAAITSVTVNRSQPFDGASGYRHVEATMSGTVAREDGAVGEYSVPIVLKYPKDGGNGAGVVDLVNTVLIHFGTINDRLISPYGRITTGDYLFEEGYTYLAVQWDKVTTDAFGPTPPEGGNHLAYGSIENSGDGFEILRDAARFLRDPSAFEGSPPPAPVDVVVSAGFSQSGMLQNAMIRRGEDRADGELLFDGHVVGFAGSLCFDLEGTVAEAVLCEASPPEDGARIITLEAQSDVEHFEFFLSTLTRYPDHPRYRRYELAGVAHIPKGYASLHPDQNPADPSPAFRGAHRNLLAWVNEGVPAPPSVFLDGSIHPDGRLEAVFDDDGHMLGGLRLPHMAAPLGTYTGLWHDGDSIFDLISGAFTPFDEAELAHRYPDHERYVSRVTRSARALYENRYIIRADKDAYRAEAAASGIE